MIRESGPLSSKKENYVRIFVKYERNSFNIIWYNDEWYHVSLHFLVDESC